MLINKTIPVTLHTSLLTFRDTDRERELQGDLLKLITNKNYNVDFANSGDKYIMYDFEKKCTLMKKFELTKVLGKNLSLDYLNHQV